MILKDRIEQIRKMIREAKYGEAFKEANKVLNEVEDVEMIKKFSLTEGRYNYYIREKMSGVVPDKTELINIIDAFYHLIQELDDAFTYNQKSHFNEVGDQIIQTIFESFAEIEERDRINKEILEDFVASSNHRPEYYLTDVHDSFYKAVEMVVKSQKASASLLMRELSLGYNVSGRTIDQMEALGIIGPPQGSQYREVLVTNESELKKILRSIVEIDGKDGKKRVFIIHEKWQQQADDPENTYISELITQYLPVLKGSINELKLIHVSYTTYVDLNLIELKLILRVFPNGLSEIFTDLNYEQEIVAGFMSMGVFLWDLPIVGISSILPYCKDDNDYIDVSLVTVVKSIIPSRHL